MKKTTLFFALITFAFSAFSQDDATFHVKKNYKSPDSENVYTFVEQNPVFPGGDDSLIRFLLQNIKYPEYERKHKIEGKILLRFIINQNGAVDNVHVSRSSGNANLDKEAQRVVSMLPNFKPGHQQGEPVRVYFNLPVVFKL